MNGSARKIMAAGAAAILIGMSSGAVLADDNGAAPAAQTTAPQQAPAAKPAPAPAMHMHGMHAPKHAASASVKALQEALNREGAKLNVDGHMGKNTRAALKSFQSAHGLKATGRADAKTLQALGLKAAKKAS